MRSYPTIMGIGLLCAALACAEEFEDPGKYDPRVDIEVNDDVDLTMYSSFDIIDPRVEFDVGDDMPPEFAEYQEQIEAAIVAELSEKGLERSSEDPDVLINPFVTVTEVVDPVGFYDAYWGWWYGYEYLWTINFEFERGSLLLDVIDRGDPDDITDDLLVYRGVAVGLLGEGPEVIKLQIRNVVQAIFAEWPE